MRATLLLLVAATSWAGDFPSGPGEPLVSAHCTVCHSSRMILQNRQTREGWDAEITKMQTKNGMWFLDAGSRNLMLDYLAANFAPKGAAEAMGPRPVNPLPR